MTVAIRQCRHGQMMFLDNDLYQGRMLATHGEYSEGEVDLFRQLISPGDLVVEAGACIGVHTIPLAKMVGPGGAVMAFEPQRALFYLLCGNLALNSLHDAAYAFYGAIGAARGAIRVPPIDYDAELNFGGYSLGGEEGEEVSILAIDDMDLPALRLIKADVEGMEADVLLGAKETIARYRPFLYVEDDREEKSKGLRTLMSDMGYRLILHTPRYLPAGNQLFPNMMSFNLLGIPEEAREAWLEHYQ